MRVGVQERHLRKENWEELGEERRASDVIIF